MLVSGPEGIPFPSPQRTAQPVAWKDAAQTFLSSPNRCTCSRFQAVNGDGGEGEDCGGAERHGFVESSITGESRQTTGREGDGLLAGRAARGPFSGEEAPAVPACPALPSPRCVRPLKGRRVGEASQVSAREGDTASPGSPSHDCAKCPSLPHKPVPCGCVAPTRRKTRRQSP